MKVQRRIMVGDRMSASLVVRCDGDGAMMVTFSVFQER